MAGIGHCLNKREKEHAQRKSKLNNSPCNYTLNAVWALATLHSHGASASTAWRRACLKRWCWHAVIVTTTNHILLWCCMNGIGYFAWGDLIGWRLRLRLKRLRTPLRFRHALRQALMPTARVMQCLSQSARYYHTYTHPDVCRYIMITWTWLCTRGKKTILNTVRFLTQTARFVS